MSLTREQVRQIVTDVIVDEFDSEYTLETGDITFEGVSPDQIRTLMTQAIRAVIPRTPEQEQEENREIEEYLAFLSSESRGPDKATAKKFEIEHKKRLKALAD